MGKHKFPIGMKAELDSPERLEGLEMDHVLDLIGAAPGMTVADVGCGTGFFAVPTARRVGPGGKVYAVDVAAEMVAEVKKRGEREGLTNLKPLVSGENELPVPDGSADLCFMAFVFHELEDSGRFLNEVKRILKPEGRLAVMDWKRVESPMGPPLGDRIKEEDMRRTLASNGFRVLKSGDLHQWVYYFITETA